METQDIPINNPEQEDTIEAQNIISLNKFIILSIFSFGLYEIWWMYKAWRFFQQKDKLDIMPAMRALFSIFFLYSLFTTISDFAKKKGYSETYPSAGLFIGYLIANLAAHMDDPWWLVSFLSFVFLIPAFKALNFGKQNSTEFTVNEQQSYSGRQIALIVVGTILWLLIIRVLTMD